MSVEDTGTQIGEAGSKIEIAEHKRVAAQDNKYTQLDRATILEHLEVLEMKKASFLTGVYIQLENGNFPESHLPMAQEMAKI